MEFISTRKKSPVMTASGAILQGLAPDGGLYVPGYFPSIPLHILSSATSYPEMAYEVLAPYFSGDVLENQLADICVEAFDFPVPIHWLSTREAVLELFQGPTAAFKDFGARFLAVCMERLLNIQERKLTILVATSGDTGGAVAAAFHGRKGIGVKVLFPKGKVSQRQEKQLTCWGGNVEAYAVDGTFDDCQRMVKMAFMDHGLSEQYGLSSANSINLGRLLPQSVYAMYASLIVFSETGEKPMVIIPSGNVGNCCGTYWAKAEGAPIGRVVLAVNANQTIPDYLAQGIYQARKSVSTLANAMDVGDPSNMERLMDLFPDHRCFSEQVSAYSVSDDGIRATIERVWRQYGYIVCPHTATGERVRELLDPKEPSIVYATAHPAKFDTVVEPIIQSEVPIPANLARLLDQKGSCQEIPADYHLLFA
jgi:threonine synthase